jgi:hypothetical protein
MVIRYQILSNIDANVRSIWNSLNYWFQCSFDVKFCITLVEMFVQFEILQNIGWNFRSMWNFADYWCQCSFDVNCRTLIDENVRSMWNSAEHWFKCLFNVKFCRTLMFVRCELQNINCWKCPFGVKFFTSLV